MDKTEAPELLETMAVQGEAGNKNGAGALTERRAKIICTLGPSSNSEAMIRELLGAGMDVARLNFSHGTHEEHARVIERVRRAAEKEGRTVCILQDLQGPKMRTGRLKYRTPVALKTGSRVTITPRDVPGTTSVISTTFQDLAREVNTGSRILLSDGLIELRVKAIRNEDVECEVVNGGLLAEHQGINLPGAVLSVPSLTQKDYKDLEFGLEHGVDIVAVSFVRCAEDVRRVKRLIGERKSDVPVIAKLEKPQAIEDLDNILEAADGVMVARGDLGVEMPPETVPIIQKNAIRRASDFRKPVITATQMLESMIENPRPTRAEASDVANAVFDGTDAVMLSGETASGRYPREAVTIMARIVVEAETHLRDSEPPRRRREHRASFSIAETICESIAHAAQDVKMRAIAVFTDTGNTARLISKHRPRVPVFAFTPFPEVGNRLNLLWGVQPVVLPQAARSSEEMVQGAERQLLQLGKVAPGDVVGVVAGTQQTSGSTNFIRLQVVSPPDQRRPERRSTGRSAAFPRRRK
ncbi:MAG TPA: pyruvate kinase [Terriglobales bacterium]|nr:pyruvate kinase [Terriglobales bacterium]